MNEKHRQPFFKIKITTKFHYFNLNIVENKLSLLKRADLYQFQDVNMNA